MKQNEITLDKVQEVLEQQFPKGECKERGAAIVLFAYFKMLVDAKDQEYKERIEELEAENSLLQEQNNINRESAKFCPSCGYLLPNHSDDCGRYPLVVKDLQAKIAMLTEALDKISKYEPVNKDG